MRGGTARRARRSRSAIVLANFLVAALVVSWAAKISTDRGRRRGRGRLRRPPRVIVLALVLLRRRLVDRLPGARHSRSSARTSACSRGRRSTSGCRSPRPGSAQRHPDSREKNELCSRVEVPADQPPTRLGRHRPARSQQGRRSSTSSRWSATLTLFLVAGLEEARLVPSGISEHRRVERRVRPQPDHHADDGPRRARLPAVPDDAVLLHLLQQHHRDHPRSCSSRRTRASRMPMVLALMIVGDLQRRRHHASRARPLPEELGRPAGRARRRSCLLVVLDRVRLDVPRPAVLAGGPTLRQHARRSPDPGDVRGALRRRCGRRSITLSSCRSRSRCSSR